MAHKDCEQTPGHVPNSTRRGHEHSKRARRHFDRRVWFRLVTVVLSVSVLWGVPETIVRIVDPRLEEYRDILFGEDPNSPKLFMKDSRLSWKLRPNTDLTFLNTMVRTDRNGFRSEEVGSHHRLIMCLGDSTTFGWRVGQSESFPARLDALLRSSQEGERQWHVINAGVPGYSSIQLRLQAERLIPAWRPEVVIICIGNNEAWPVRRSDSRRIEHRTMASTLSAALSASRFLVWVSETILPDRPGRFVAPTLSDAVPRVDKEEFEDALREVVRIARRSDAIVILVSPSVNLYSPPKRVMQVLHWDSLEAYHRGFQELWKRREFGPALAEIDEQLADDPESFYHLWLKGFTLSLNGDSKTGHELLEMAFEKHPFPDRCKRSYRRIIEKVAREERTAFLDINRHFTTRTGVKDPSKLYLDWCHPTPLGHTFVAQALSAIIREF